MRSRILLVAQRLAMTEPLSETERLKLSDRLFETVFDPPQRSRGGDDLALSFRDMYLSDTVQHLIDEFGLAATRSAATRDKSGNEFSLFHCSEGLRTNWVQLFRRRYRENV